MSLRPTDHAATLFDFDGVLCASEPVFYRTFVDAVAPLGRTLDWTSYVVTFVHGATTVEAWLGADASGADAVGRRWREGLQRAAARGEVTVDRELVEAIRRFGERHPTAIATSSTPWWVETVLDAAGLTAPCAVVARAGGLRKKPAPDVYISAAARLGVPPDRCLAIEDAQKGVAAARAVGMTVAVLRTPHGAAAESVADQVVTRAELLDALGVPRARCVAVIPARFGATRLPGKPLIHLAGRPMIEHVWRRVCAATVFDDVIVATDDARIVAVAQAFGARVVSTRPDHPSGTDRVREAIEDVEAAFVVNVQGDEPLVDPRALDALVAALRAEPAAALATVVHPLEPGADDDPSKVKVVLDRDDWALWFSRAAIPYARDEPPERWQHAGVYAWRRDAFERVVREPRSPAERAESLEQLRALQNGLRIKAIRWPTWVPCSVDTPADAARATSLLGAISSPRSPS